MDFRAVTGRNINGSGSIVQAFEKVSLYIILRSYIGMLVYCVILSSTSALIIFCGWSLYELIVPLISVYIPTSIFFLSALLGFDGWDTEMLTISIMLDPILEPLVIMYFIKCYRRPIARFLCCGQNSVCGFETSERKHNGLNRTTTGTNTNASTSNRNQISPESKETSHHSFHG
ncbi:unnamed protein product, partial [Mesorhabditis belari]|uniref:Uncharacterized protein n=1 Tax=Mesorhabditis belari TaxID=2138241 RepID=A0AAF3FSA2_9BILA